MTKITVDINADWEPLNKFINSVREAKGKLTYTAEYAAYVEFPTSYTSKAPPFQPIYAWVKRNWSDLSNGLKEAALDGSTEADSPSHIKSTAWLVVKAIKKHGTQGVYFATRTYNKYRASEAMNVAEEYEGSDDFDAPRKIIEDIIGGMETDSQDIVREEAYDTGTLHDSTETETGKEVNLSNE